MEGTRDKEGARARERAQSTATREWHMNPFFACALHLAECTGAHNTPPLQAFGSEDACDLGQPYMMGRPGHTSRTLLWRVHSCPCKDMVR